MKSYIFCSLDIAESDYILIGYISQPKIFQLIENESHNLFFQHMLLHYFDLKKTATEVHRLLFEAYGDETLSERTM